MVAQYAGLGVTAAGAAVFGFGLVAAFVLRMWKTPAGEFSERHHTKLYALAVSMFAMFAEWLFAAMGNHSFGHILLAGHQINVGMYTAWLFATSAFAVFLGLSFSEVEHYSYLSGLLQAAPATLWLIGSRSADVANVPLSVCILGFFFQLLAVVYGYFWCVPSVEWQQQRGSNRYLIIKALLYVPFFYYAAAYTFDNTFKNAFKDDENKMAIVNLVIQSVHMVLGGLYVLWMVDVLPTPPVFQVGQGISGGVGMITHGGGNNTYVQVQQIEQTGAPAATAPATQSSSAPINNAQAAKYQLKW